MFNVGRKQLHATYNRRQTSDKQRQCIFNQLSPFLRSTVVIVISHVGQILWAQDHSTRLMPPCVCSCIPSTQVLALQKEYCNCFNINFFVIYSGFMLYKTHTNIQPQTFKNIVIIFKSLYHLF